MGVRKKAGKTVGCYCLTESQTREPHSIRHLATLIKYLGFTVIGGGLERCKSRSTQKFEGTARKLTSARDQEKNGCEVFERELSRISVFT